MSKVTVHSRVSFAVLRKMKCADQNCLRFWVYEKGSFEIFVGASRID